MRYIKLHTVPPGRRDWLHYVFDGGEVARFLEFYVRNMQIGAVSYCVGNL